MMLYAGITSLNGRTNYGDSIEDEWVIVYLLRELTKKHKSIWAQVVDSDGQFLLVEAAGVLPAWLEPEIADNRVSAYNPHACDFFFTKERLARYGSTKENLS